jgi:hypothetical protein
VVCMRQMHVSIVIANLLICRVLVSHDTTEEVLFGVRLIICTCRCRLFRRRHEIRVRYSTTLFDGEAAESQAGGRRVMREERLRRKRRREERAGVRVLQSQQLSGRRVQLVVSW